MQLNKLVKISLDLLLNGQWSAARWCWLLQLMWTWWMKIVFFFRSWISRREVIDGRRLSQMIGGESSMVCGHLSQLGLVVGPGLGCVMAMLYLMLFRCFKSF